MHSGSRIGPYEIATSIGAGGMGEVFRARDTRLNRDVAVKVLPKDFAADADRLRRFEQEAKTLAALNHPNVLTIHDAGIHEGAPYLVNELLEGKTLREELNGGALSVPKAREYALQIAQGLAAAHGKGVVHRDLKPENIFVTKDGRVKILDFGLAKLKDNPKSSVDADVSTVVQITAQESTEPGKVMGTPTYMAPEQVRGEPVDHRADIFAFGCILYEMLTGTRAFRRDTAIASMNAILSEEPPDAGSLKPGLPPALERVVAKCLAKDRDERWQTAKDLADELRWIGQMGSQTALRNLVQAPRTKRTWVTRIAWTTLSVALVTSLVLHFLSRRPPTELGVSRFVIPLDLPEHLDVSSIAISPDGRRIAFTTFDSVSLKTKLWLRPMDSFKHVVLQEEGFYPFWSPDSRFVAFFADKKLKKLNPSGGPPQVVCEAPDGYAGSWSRAGVIVFATDTSGIFQVPAQGGEPKQVTTLMTNGVDQTRHDRAHRFPQFLPDGRHFLYYSRTRGLENSATYVASIEGGAPKHVLNEELQTVYALPGYLLFLVDGTLMAQTFDLKSLRLTGEALPIVEEVEAWSPSGEVKFSVSNTGVLAYYSSHSNYERQLVWIDRTGKELSRLPIMVSDGFYNFSLSPDEKRLVMDRYVRGKPEIWLVDSQKGAPSRFTFGQGRDWYPLWSPAGNKIFFSSNRGGQHHLYQKLSSGVADEELLFKDEDPVYHMKVPCDVSPDGRFLLFFRQEPGDTPWRLWVLPLDGKSKPIPLRNTTIGERCGVFSPDGRWVAYTSDESGSSQVYVQAFPAADRKWQISDTFGFHPRWNPNGQELFYVMADQKARKLMAVDVKTGASFEHGSPQPLFDINVEYLEMRAQYTVSTNGQRFLISKVLEQTNAAPSYPMTVVFNWKEMLRR